jgi:hypothetical protein
MVILFQKFKKNHEKSVTSLAECQIKPIDFTTKKVWKFLIKIQLTKSDLKWTRGDKSTSPHAN